MDWSENTAPADDTATEGLAKTARALIIIPAWNEGGVIGRVITDLVHQNPVAHREILVIDDGSTDNTRNEALNAGARVLTLVQNLGYGYALQAGYQVAYEGGYDIVLQMDGDGQHSVDSVLDVIEPVLKGECDVAIGSRALSKVHYPMPLARRLGQKTFAWILYRLSGLKIGDPTSGFQALNRKALLYYLSDQFPGDYPDTNMLLFLKLHGIRIREVAATFRINEQGTSMHGGFIKPLYYIYKMSLSMFLIYMRFRNAQRVKDENV